MFCTIFFYNFSMFDFLDLFDFLGLYDFLGSFDLFDFSGFV